MVLSLFGVILRPVYDQLPDLSEILNGSIRLPSKVFFTVWNDFNNSDCLLNAYNAYCKITILQMRRVLPAVFVISEWLSMPSVNRLYRRMPSLESIETSLIQVDTWKLFADVANTLVNAESKGILSRTVAQSDGQLLFSLLDEVVCRIKLDNLLLSRFCFYVEESLN